MRPDEPLEITFIALPSINDIKRKGASDQELDQYRNCQYRIRQAQESCAVLATKFLRPEDYRMHQMDYRHKVHMARKERNQALLKVFSEKCTKGL